MAVARPNKAVLLAAAVFVAMFMGLAHFYGRTPVTRTSAAKNVSNALHPQLQPRANFVLVSNIVLTWCSILRRRSMPLPPLR